MSKSSPDSQHAQCGSEEEYRVLLESNPNPMWVFDNETLRFLAVNEAAIRHYGYSREEFLGMTVTDIRPAEEVRKLLKHFSQLRRWQMANAGVWRHRKKDGTVIEMEISASSVTFHGRRAWLVSSREPRASITPSRPG